MSESIQELYSGREGGEVLRRMNYRWWINMHFMWIIQTINGIELKSGFSCGIMTPGIWNREIRNSHLPISCNNPFRHESTFEHSLWLQLIQIWVSISIKLLSSPCHCIVTRHSRDIIITTMPRQWEEDKSQCPLGEERQNVKRNCFPHSRLNLFEEGSTPWTYSLMYSNWDVPTLLLLHIVLLYV